MRMKAAWLLWLMPFVLAGMLLMMILGGFPDLGHDFPFFVPALLEGKWHVLHQGFTPMYYAPHFCGGSAVYGNPNDIFYSLPQLLVFVTDPMTALLAWVVLAMIAGYVGWQFFGRDVMRMNGAWAHVLAATMTAHGFFAMHAAAGHVQMAGMPLIGWMLWLLLERRTATGVRERRGTGWSHTKRAAVFALISGVIVYSAGYLTMIFFAMTALLLLPLLWIWPHAVPQRKELVARAAWCGCMAFLVALSKCVAVFELMRALPRSATFSSLPSIPAAMHYIVTALWAMPQDEALYAGLPSWLLHEYAMFISPAVIVGMIAGAWMLRKHTRRWDVLLYVMIVASVMILLVGGVPPVPQLLGYVPLMSSMRVSSRFLFVFTLPMILAGIAGLAAASAHVKQRTGNAVAIGLAVLTVIMFYAVNARPAAQVWRSMPYAPYAAMMDAIDNESLLSKPITTVVYGRTDFNGTTGMLCNDALLWWDRQKLAVLRPGPVTNIEDGHYNMIKPACYANDHENRCGGSMLIPVSDKENLERFTRGERTTWRQSVDQHIANWISLFALVFIAGALLSPLVLRRKTGTKRRKK
jgi:hypothetical protein